MVSKDPGLIRCRVLRPVLSASRPLLTFWHYFACMCSAQGFLCAVCVAGLTVFAIGPSTLAQGQTLVAQARGNTALALMLLVVSNILAVFTAPFLVKAILSSRVDAGSISLQPTNLLINLVITILTPAIVGKVPVLALACHANALPLLLKSAETLHLIICLPWMHVTLCSRRATQMACA